MLLAFSGGPDSTALFFLLLEYGVKFSVAHVDHGWRDESAAEAEQIRQLCDQHGVRCYIRHLESCDAGSNLEERARDARYQFFRELCENHGYTALVLGHHKNDLAETVLKRTLEGASLARLDGMSGEVLRGLQVDFFYRHAPPGRVGADTWA